MFWNKKEEAPKIEPEKVLFDPAIMKKIEEAVSILAKIIPIKDTDAKKLWFKDKVLKGFTVQEIIQKLKEVNYDFTAAGTYLDNTYTARTKSETAYAQVTKIQEEDKKKKEVEKTGARLTWIVLAFTISGVGAFSSWMIKRSMDGADLELTAAAMPGGDILGSFINGGWVLAGASGGVGLLLLAFFLIERTVTKTKEQSAQTEALGLKKSEQAVIAEAQKREIEEELAKKTQ